MTTPLTQLARHEVQQLTAYNAGLSSEEVQRRYAVKRVVKLASNENPLGLSPLASAAIHEAATTCHFYPDAECSLLRQTLANKLAIDANRFIFGNGSEDLISIISKVFLDHGDEVVTVVPSFGLHILAPITCGAEVKTVPMQEDMQFDVAGIIKAIGPRTRLVMFSCPSNPVGSALKASELQVILDAIPNHCLLIFDEAYYEYASNQPDYPNCLALLEQSQKAFILLRTFSKAYALAGLRIGYGIVSDSSLTILIDKVRNPFNVNRLAQIAAVAALQDGQHLQKSIRLVEKERNNMLLALNKRGYCPIPTYANFLFFATKQPADKVAEHLLKHGVVIKPWKEAGYTHYVRVSISSEQDNKLFLAALDTL